MAVPVDSVLCLDPTLSLPRILCLHGGGTNSQIFRAQCRIIRRHLESSFRLVFPDAPYFSKPGPDVTSVYEAWGPFRSWMRPQPDADGNSFSAPCHCINDVIMPVDEKDAAEVIRAIDGSLADAMEADDQRGATGQWVGLLGFSQGAKMAASLLFREQYRMERQGWVRTYQEQLAAALGQRSMFRFAVLLAGRGPLVTLDEDFTAFYGPEKDIWEPILQLPTVHVHGTQDDGLAMHRDFRDRCCTEESTTLVEWNGNHRVPIKAVHVSAVVSALMKAYQQSPTL